MLTAAVCPLYLVSSNPTTIKVSQTADPDGMTDLYHSGYVNLGSFLLFFFFFFFFESTWATHWAPSAVRAAKRTEAAEAELHAGRVDRWA